MRRWLFALSLAMVGILAAGLILLRDDDAGQGAAFNPPTPAPLITTPVPTATPIPLVNTGIPGIELASMDGDTLSLTDFDGKSVILNFWATWCVPCVREMPAMQSLRRSKFGDGSGASRD